MPGPDLKWKFSHHCVAKMNSTHSIIIGGQYEAKKSLIFQTVDFSYTDGPNLMEGGRYDHACAHIRNKEGINYVIAAGGKDNQDQSLDTSEMLQIKNDNSLKWFSGKFMF